MAVTTLHSKSWILFFTEISDEAPEQNVMEEAHDHLVKKCALPKLLDAVGLSDTDLRELLDYNKLTMSERALMGRAVRAVNFVAEDSKKRRMVATPQQISKSLETSIVAAAGCEASNASIAWCCRVPWKIYGRLALWCSELALKVLLST